MSSKPFYVVSDLHIGGVPGETERAFLRFLEHLKEDGSGLLINGDLFEFGIAYRNVVPRRQVRVLAKLAELVDAGLPVYFAGGNHDYLEWGGHVLHEDLGLTLLEDRTVLELAGRRTLVIHGDAVCRGRPSMERRIARSRLVVAFFRWLHPDLVERIQARTTTTRRQVRQHVAGGHGGPKTHAREIEAWAIAELKRDPALDLLIAGHGHLPGLRDVGGGRFYLNTGDWISHFTYAVLPPRPAPPELRHWPTGQQASKEADQEEHARVLPINRRQAGPTG